MLPGTQEHDLHRHIKQHVAWHTGARFALSYHNMLPGVQEHALHCFVTTCCLVCMSMICIVMSQHIAWYAGP